MEGVLMTLAYGVGIQPAFDTPVKGDYCLQLIPRCQMGLWAVELNIA